MITQSEWLSELLKAANEKDPIAPDHAITAEQWAELRHIPVPSAGIELRRLYRAGKLKRGHRHGARGGIFAYWEEAPPKKGKPK